MWALRGLRDGVLTTRWPARPDQYAAATRGPATVLTSLPARADQLDGVCPTGAIRAERGGLISPSYAVTGGVGATVPVDVWLPGSPPSPFSILYALLLALGRLPAGPGADR